MSKKFQITVTEAKTTEQASYITQRHLDSQVVVLHTGTNDLRKYGAEDTECKIARITDDLLSKGKKVVLSKLLPREGYHLNNLVDSTNTILEDKYNQTKNVVLTNVDAFYFYDKPNHFLYSTQQRNGEKLPLLHLNKPGLMELSRQIQWSIKQVLKH